MNFLMLADITISHLSLSPPFSAVLAGGALDGPRVERGLAERADPQPAGRHLGTHRDRGPLHPHAQSDTRRE